MHKHTHERALNGFWGVPGEMGKGAEAHCVTVASFPHVPAVHEQSDTPSPESASLPRAIALSVLAPTELLTNINMADGQMRFNQYHSQGFQSS